MQLKSIDTTRIAVCLSFVVITVFASTSVLAKDYTIKKGQSSGSTVTSLFSFRGLADDGGIPSADNRTALSTFQGKDSLGEVYGQIVADYDTVGRYNRVPGCPGYPFIVFMSQGVLNYKKGQLHLEASEGSAPNQGCLVLDSLPDLAPASTTLTIKYDIVGGTGDYEGASGELTIESTGVLLHNHLNSGDDDQFGSFQSTYEGWFEVD